MYPDAELDWSLTPGSAPHMTVHDGHASYLTAVKALSTRGRPQPGADPIGHPENPARLRQIVGVNGGNGVGRPCRAASLTRSPEPICRDRTDRPLAGYPLCRRTLGSARIQHHVGKRREPTRNNGHIAGSAGLPRPARRPVRATEAPPER